MIMTERRTIMNISQIQIKMIEYSHKNTHDINHFLKVHAFAKMIAENENLDSNQQIILEIAAIIHDIACPLCRQKYGNTNGKLQEKEGMILAKEFLKDISISHSMKERIIFLVGHHHTIDQIDGIDYQILLEADYLVNADEAHYSKENIENTKHTLFKTSTGIHLLESIY